MFCVSSVILWVRGLSAVRNGLMYGGTLTRVVLAAELPTDAVLASVSFFAAGRANGAPRFL